MESIKSKTCLVVDDSRVVRKVAIRIANELGFACEEAADGKQALEQCQKAIPDAVLLDWKMPVMDGTTFLDRLRKLPGGKNAKVIFVTTENGRVDIQKALKAGADEYIMKPFDREIMESKFRQVGLID